MEHEYKISNYDELCSYYVEKGNSIFEKYDIKMNYRHLLYQIRKGVFWFDLEDKPHSKGTPFRIILRHLTQSDIELACSFAIDYLKLDINLIENLQNVSLLLLEFIQNNKLDFCLNSIEYTITMDIFNFFEERRYISLVFGDTTHHIQYSKDAIWVKNTKDLFSYFANICDNYNIMFGKNVILCNIGLEYNGFFDQNKINFISSKNNIVKPGTELYNFFLNINNDYIFTIDEIIQFYGLLNYKWPLFSKFIQYANVDYSYFNDMSIKEMKELPKLYFYFIEKIL